MQLKNSFRINTKEMQMELDLDCALVSNFQPSPISMAPLSARMAVPQKLKSVRQLSQSNRARGKIGERIQLLPPGDIKHSLSLNNLHPASSRSINQEQTQKNQQNHKNNHSNNSAIFNLDGAKKEERFFKNRKLPPSIGISLATSPSTRQALQKKISSLHNINLSAILPGVQGSLLSSQRLPTLQNHQKSDSSSFLLNGRGANGIGGGDSNIYASILQNNNSMSSILPNSSMISQEGSLTSRNSKKKSFYHHSHIFSLRQFSNLKDNFQEDEVSDESKENKQNYLIKQFRFRVQQYLMKSKFSMIQASKDFQECSRIQDSLFKGDTTNGQSKGNSFISNTVGGNNALSFFTNNMNNDDPILSSSPVNQSSNVDSNKSLLNIDSSRFNYTKLSKHLPGNANNVKVDIYIEDQFGKQRKATRVLNHMKLQDMLLDKFKPILTDSQNINPKEKIDFFAKEYERVLQTIQTKTFKLKIPYYYEPLMQPFNDFYSIDLEKKKQYESKEQWKELDEQLLKQALEGGGISSNQPRHSLLPEEDELDSNEEEVQDEDIEMEQEDDEEERLNLQGKIVSPLQKEASKNSKSIGDQIEGIQQGSKARQVIKKVVKKKKKRKQDGEEVSEEGDDENDEEGNPQQPRKVRQSQGGYQYSTKLIRRKRAPKERSAMEEYLTQRPSSKRQKKTKLDALPNWQPQQEESVNEEDSESDYEEEAKAPIPVVQPQQSTLPVPQIDYSPEKKKTVRKKREKKSDQQAQGKSPQIAQYNNNNSNSKNVNTVTWKKGNDDFEYEEEPKPKPRKKKNVDPTQPNNQNTTGSNFNFNGDLKNGGNQNQGGGQKGQQTGNTEENKNNESEEESSYDEEVLFEYADQQPDYVEPQDNIDPNQDSPQRDENGKKMPSKYSGVNINYSKKGGQTQPSQIPSIQLKQFSNPNYNPNSSEQIPFQQMESLNDSQNQANQLFPNKKRIGTGLLDELVKVQHLLEFNVFQFKKKRNAPQPPQDVQFDEEEDQKLFNSIFQWQYEVDQDIEDVHRSKQPRVKKEKKKDDSDESENEPEQNNRREEDDKQDGSVHSSEITDFGPANPLQQNQHVHSSDDFSDLD